MHYDGTNDGTLERWRRFNVGEKEVQSNGARQAKECCSDGHDGTKEGRRCSDGAQHTKERCIDGRDGTNERRRRGERVRKRESERVRRREGAKERMPGPPFVERRQMPQPAHPSNHQCTQLERKRERGRRESAQERE